MSNEVYALFALLPANAGISISHDSTFKAWCIHSHRTRKTYILSYDASLADWQRLFADLLQE